MRPPAATAGRSTRSFKRMRAELRSRRLPCVYCGQPIAYDGHTNAPLSFTLAHALPVSTHPELAEAWSNVLGAAHRSCNSSAGVGPAPLALGLVSEGD